MAVVEVAMSGGVDSSTAAALLLEQGHAVSGVTMVLGHSSSAPKAAEEVCRHLGIPHRTVDLARPFSELVVGAYADAYAAGRTPNPCVTCNERVKFGLLLDDVLSRGADLLATGHYARVLEGEPRRLAMGVDRTKDQSYFLYRLSPEVLEKVVFPIGGMKKSDVRRIAAQAGLPTAQREESQEACFVGAEGYEQVVRQLRPDAFEPGPIVDSGGNVLGTHNGIARYTIGQRKGLGVATGKALYVTAIDPASNTVHVGTADEACVTEIVAKDVVWHDARAKGACTFRYRHATSVLAGTFSVDESRLVVRSEEPLRGVAPGQALVCYKGDVVMGGGTIEGAR
ncbi:MAG: tRNA 2-thiouridine(34) synthase MnmA [Coriobacteriia bacterium]